MAILTCATLFAQNSGGGSGGSGGSGGNPGGNSGGQNSGGTNYVVTSFAREMDYADLVTGTVNHIGIPHTFAVLRGKLGSCESQLITWENQFRAAFRGKRDYEYYLAKCKILMKDPPSTATALPFPYNYNNVEVQGLGMPDMYSRARAGFIAARALRGRIVNQIQRSHNIQSQWRAKLDQGLHVSISSPDARALNAELDALELQAMDCVNRLAQIERQWRLRTIGILSVASVVPDGWIHDLSHISTKYPQIAMIAEQSYNHAIQQGYYEDPPNNWIPTLPYHLSEWDNFQATSLQDEPEPPTAPSVIGLPYDPNR